MKSPKCYSLLEIKKLWNKYETISGLRILKDGKWKYVFGNERQNLINATRAEVIQLSEVMTFPEYLEKLIGGRNGNTI